MQKQKLVRITTIPLSLEKLLEGQLEFMQNSFNVIAVSAEKERLENYAEKENVRNFHVKLTRKITPYHDLKAVYQLYRFLKKEQPYIVHSHTPKAGIVGMMASYLAKVPHRLHTVAGLPLMETKGVKRKILIGVEKLTYKFATKVYPNSKGLEEFILSNRLTHSNKLKIIGKGSSNGIDTHYFSKHHFTPTLLTQKQSEIGIPSNDFVFIFVGRIVKDKGINELVSAFKKLSNLHQNVSLLLVGPYENDLDPIAEPTQNEIADNKKIFTVGFQNDVRIFFAISHALVFPSYREGFPNVVLQAGAMGLPAIVSNINGCNEIISHRRNGVIIPVKDTEATFSAMEELLINNALYQSLVANSRSAITTRFERKTIWDALLREYEQL